VSRVPLSDEETKVIVTDPALKVFQQLGRGEQREIINRLLNIVESSALPSSFVREQIANLDIIAVGDQCRLYTRLVEQIPEGNVEYHVIFLFYIDTSHDYPRDKLGKYSQSAEQFSDQLTDFNRVNKVEEYLEHHGALSANELEHLLSD